MTLNEILTKFKDTSTAPGELTDMNMYLAAEYADKSDELAQILIKKNVTWFALRTNCNSDKQADRAWDATKDGQVETTLRLYLKSTEKLMSALRAHLRTKETEARNQF